MNKIGILTCLKSNDVCARAGCLKAFNHRTDFFARYLADTELTAMMTCNGCASKQPAEPEADAGIIEKADRLVHENIIAVHVGVCRLKEDGKVCPRITKICQMLEKRGIQIVYGTHKE